MLFERINPMTGAVASTAKAMKAADMAAIAQRAASAFPAWAAMGPNARRAILLKAAVALESKAEAFVEAMNAKGKELGMNDTSFVESTGLSSRNKSSARDLATLVRAAHQHPIIRELSVSPQAKVEIGRRNLQFHTTNRLVLRSDWDIGLQKTGYITEAGRCLVMQATLAGRPLIMVFLDSAGKHSRLGDAERVRRWIMQTGPAATPAGPRLTS